MGLLTKPFKGRHLKKLCIICACILFTLPPTAWDDDEMARAPAFILDKEATLEVESMCSGGQSSKDGKCMGKNEMSPLFKRLRFLLAATDAIPELDIWAQRLCVLNVMASKYKRQNSAPGSDYKSPHSYKGSGQNSVLPSPLAQLSQDAY